MYAAAPSPFAPRRAAQPMSQMYARVGVETAVDQASAHRLVAMLFEGLLDAMDRARGAMDAGQVDAKCKAIAHAVRIVDEGLRCSLNTSAGGTLASDLSALYAYVMRRLTEANLRNDRAALDECRRLVLPLQQAWAEIGPEVQPAA